jgi:hypothetical protein
MRSVTPSGGGFGQMNPPAGEIISHNDFRYYVKAFHQLYTEIICSLLVHLNYLVSYKTIEDIAEMAAK